MKKTPLYGFIIGITINVVVIIIISIKVFPYVLTHGGFTNSDNQLMLFIIAIGIILGGAIINGITTGLGALIGWLYGKMKNKINYEKL